MVRCDPETPDFYPPVGPLPQLCVSIAFPSLAAQVMYFSDDGSTCLICSGLTTALAQNAAPNSNQTQGALPDNTIRVTVNLVQVDAEVTDSKGKPVTDLKAADFEILQDGKPQTITNLSYITISPGTSPPRPLTTNVKGVPLPPPARLKVGDVQRTIAFVVDDLGLSFEGTAYVRQALKKFVDRQIQPGDLVAIIRTVLESALSSSSLRISACFMWRSTVYGSTHSAAWAVSRHWSQLWVRRDRTG
jgi:hypothetical protein